MWNLFCHCLCLICPTSGVSGKLFLVIVAFPGIHSYFGLCALDEVNNRKELDPAH